MSGLNPELKRNLWLELSSRRLIFIPLIVALVLSPWLLLEGNLGSAAGTGRVLFDFLVPVWGTWLVANSVVSEIRSRTWDLQRLSALSPWAMLWGKLIGAPIMVWYAGAFCLIPVVAHALNTGGLSAALIDIAYYLMLGLISHSAGLLASLIAVRKTHAPDMVRRISVHDCRHRCRCCRNFSVERLAQRRGPCQDH